MNVSPRFLTRYEYEREQWPAYMASVQQGNIVVSTNKWGFRQTVLGYAELPVHTNISQYSTFQEFKKKIEKVALYVVWFEDRFGPLEKK